MAAAQIDIDKSFLLSVLKGGREAVTKCNAESIVSAMLMGDNGPIFQFVTDHTREYGDTPSIEYLAAKTGCDLSDVEANDPLDLYIKTIKTRHLWISQKQLLASLDNNVAAMSPDVGHDDVNKYLKTVREMNLAHGGVSELFDFVDEVKAQYEATKKGLVGVASGWPSMDRLTYGFQKSQLILFCARSGVGKTWLLLKMAKQARDDGYYPLFISAEMGKVQIASRFCALELKYNYDDIWNGTLGVFAEKTFYKRLDELKGEGGISITGDGFDSTVESVDDCIAMAKPDIVFLDGLYLIQSKGKNRFEVVANTANEIKRMAIRHQVPIVASTQFNRDVDMDDQSTVRLENIGLSDALSWNSDCVFALVQSEGMKDEGCMVVRPLKIREGHIGNDIVVNWNFQCMDFSEKGLEELIDKKPVDFSDGEKPPDVKIDDGMLL